MLDRLEVQHVLKRDHKIDLFEFNAMLPWQLDIKLLQIQRDLDDESERIKKQKSQMNWVP